MTALCVSGSAERLIIRVPAAMAREWTGTERVGIAAQQSIKSHASVEILVEKEFRRLHGAKYNPDLYPNPLESTAAVDRV